MAVDWNDYKQFSDLLHQYLPAQGEGDSKATQLVTAVNKLVYKWYNDGDVYDTTGALKGWENDLSSYANWIYRYNPSYRNLLDQVFECYTDDDYESLLWDISKKTFQPEFLEALAAKDVAGSIYDCKGPYEFKYDEGEEGDYYDEEYEDDYDDYDRDYAPEDEDVESAVDINAAEGEDAEDNESIVEEELSEEEQFEELLDYLKDDFDLLLGSLEKLQRGSSEDMAVGKTIAKTFYNNMQDALAAVGERF